MFYGTIFCLLLLPPFRNQSSSDRDVTADSTRQHISIAKSKGGHGLHVTNLTSKIVKQRNIYLQFLPLQHLFINYFESTLDSCLYALGVFEQSLHAALTPVLLLPE